jgi:hypothetical protein
MADVSVTATEVLKTSATVVDSGGVFGETVTAGQVVYKLSSDGKWYKADANLSAAAAALKGIALNGGAANQPAVIAIGGTIDPGFTVTVGTVYVLSATAGGIAPAADLATGMYVGIVGVGLAADTLGLIIYSSGVAVP